ncbi:HlyD family efflux transporter periplasmic adaptor subunit [Calothrix sp. NIES-2098]|uniref:HlyD family efflux transporter periplasmic adaptor subunit n=1 Tax=Calothrix sp. NIES-2098 TaxID=1954171 RepID=UPI000B5F23B7|nr:multidrug resistance efflux pump [Calothrix sp. NIES-2098]
MKILFKSQLKQDIYSSVVLPKTKPHLVIDELDEEDVLLDSSSEAVSLYGGTAASIRETPSQPANLDNGIKAETVNPHTSLTQPSANWSGSLQTILDDPPSALPYQMVLGGAIFGMAVATWATIGQIDEVGKASGKLVPQGDPYKIHTLVSGKIARIDIKEGETVKAGQVIAQLDKEIALNEVERLSQERTAYKTQLIQTEALIEKTQLEAKTRVAIANAEIKGQEAIISQVNAKIQSQEVAIAQGQGRANTSQALLEQLNFDAAAQKERLERLKSLVEQGAISKDQVFQAQQNLGDRQRTITQQTGEIQQAVTDSKRLQADLRRVLAEAQQLQVQLAQKQAEGNTALLQAEQAIQKLQVEKTQLTAKIQQTDKLLQQAKAQLRQLSLTAPIDGMVLALNINNSGEVVQPGQTIAELAPQNAPLILETVLPTREAGFIKIGNTAKVKFDAYPYQDYGVITGKVISISSDSKPDPQLGAVYRVGISLDRNYVQTHHQIVKFKAGQTGHAEIVIRRRRIADILLEPIRQLQEGGINL